MNNGRMGTRYEDFLARRAASVDVNDREVGHSGYFSTPTPDLDPRLFHRGSDRLIPEVSRWILTTLYRYWERKYKHPQTWSTVWIAGSGITHQWSGGRAVGNQPGDLDVLIGVDWERFFYMNPRFQGTSPEDMSEQMNSEFHTELWPRTAATILPSGGASFEVTFYVNATGSDIRNIHPYAAYNVSDDEWTVRPIELPADWNPQTYFPKGWWDQVHREEAHARALMQHFRTYRDRLAMQQVDSGQWLNTLTAMHTVVREAGDLFHAIHQERKRAFSPEGAGFKDYYNFRWQAHKYLGSGPMLHQLASLDADAHRDLNSVCYDGATLDGGHALQLAVQAGHRSF